MTMCFHAQVHKTILLFAAFGLFGSTAFAQSTPLKGRVDFDGLPPANVEVNLTDGVFQDLFGLGDAALAGVTSALTDSSNHHESSESMMFVAKQVDELRNLFPLVKDVIHEVRIRVYEDEQPVSDLSSRFRDQLKADRWHQIAKIRDDDTSVHVSLLRQEGSIRGVFVMVSDDDATVLANLVCDASPDNVTQLANLLTKIGLDTGLRKEMEQFVQRMKH